jgi:hypothetical protein
MQHPYIEFYISLAKVSFVVVFLMVVIGWILGFGE